MKKEADSLYKNSIKILKKVQLKKGGCLASLPGHRYPYVYPRDNAFCILAFISAGMMEEAKKALNFVLRGQLESGAFPQRYDSNGKNASYKPIQIDGTALTLYSFVKYVERTHDLNFAKKNWEIIEKAADYIKKNLYEEKNLIYTPNSIHEFPPMEEGLEIWANCACCAALIKISKIGELLKIESEYLELANKIKEGILKYMWNSGVRSFVSNIRIKESSSVEIEPDVSQYALGYFGILPDNDKRVRDTVIRIEKELGHNKLGGICRYPKTEGRHNGGYGPWIHFTLMLAQHYIKLKDRVKANKYIKWVLRIAYKGELPEHISSIREFEEYVSDFSEAGLLRKDRLLMIENARKHPSFKKGIAYISLPLSWAHAQFIITWNLYKKTFKD